MTAKVFFNLSAAMSFIFGKCCVVIRLFKEVWGFLFIFLCTGLFTFYYEQAGLYKWRDMEPGHRKIMFK